MFWIIFRIIRFYDFFYRIRLESLHKNFEVTPDYLNNAKKIHRIVKSRTRHFMNDSKMQIAT